MSSVLWEYNKNLIFLQLPEQTRRNFSSAESILNRMGRLVYAIDFGTSNSLLAASDGKGVLGPIPLDAGAPDPTVMRSVLYYPNQNECLLGSRAVAEYLNRDLSGRLIRSIKRFLPVRSFIGTYVEDRPLNLEDIIGRFLLEMRRRANEHFQQDVDSVVLGRPAKFSIDEADDRFAEYRLEKSARNAGFKNIEFCPEPVAAAREFRRSLQTEKIVFVADFGGGTSDYTVVKMGAHDYQASDVLAVGGVPLAGDSLDGCVMRNRIARHFGSEVQYKVPFGKNILKMPLHLMERICSPADLAILRKQDTLQFLKNIQEWSLGPNDRKCMDQLLMLIEEQLGFGIFEEIEKSKRVLTVDSQSLLEFLYAGIEIREKITRKQFNQYTERHVTEILKGVDETLNRAGLQAADVDILCCTGGTAQIPAIQEGLAARFGAEKLQQHKHFHSVVEGLAERARDLLN